MSFQSQDVQEIMNALQPAMQEFVRRNQGNVYKSIVLSMAAVFPEDREKLMLTVGAKNKISKRTGAKFAKKNRIVISGTDAGCDGCGDSKYVASSPTNQGNITTTIDSNKASKTVNEKQIPFESVEDILERFEGNATALSAFCQARDITIPGNVKKARTIATIMMKHYDGLDNSEEEE